MSSKSSHGTEVSRSGLSVSMPSGSGLRAVEEVGEDANDQDEEVRQTYEDGGTNDDNNGVDEGNGEVTGSVVVQDRVDSEFPAALGCITKYRCGGVQQNITHAKAKACMFGLTGTSTYQFCLPSKEDRIFHIRNDARGLFFYKPVFDMGFRLPCHRFLADVLTFYSIAPSQFMPNAWRQLVCILVACVYYNLQLSVNVVRDLYELSNSDGWYSLQMRKGYGGTRQDYTLNDAEKKLKATILRQRRHAEVLMHPGRLWLCGLAPRPTRMLGIADYQFGKCNPLRVGKQKTIVNCRGERGSVRRLGRGKGVMGLSNWSSAIEQEAAAQPTLGDHHVNDQQASPSKEPMNFATIQRLRAKKKAAAAAEKSSTSAVAKDHVAAALSSAWETTPPTLEVAPAGVGDGAAQQPASSVANLPKGVSGLMDELELTLKKLKKEEVKMAKKIEEDAMSALEQEKLGRQADKVAAAQVAALELKLQNDFIEVLDAAVVSARHTTLTYKGVDLSDVPLENPEFPEGY
ncbi:hypothetical protein COLO4_29990 [Corchorus olitorius]|uniref:Transposase (putative) gypsy type domain-containing protein n=1 Tax=Corchorus olitorius TaxID=93759 RepID=A0A1R3HBU3_9ROSI|nr:hypothetical protein COLO4_29990 [Corchorus olitorius]